MAARQRHDTRDPRVARTRALKIIFQADVRGEGPDDVLRRLAGDPRGRAILDDLDLTGDAEAEAERVRRQAEVDARHETTDTPAGAPPIDGFTRQLVLGVADHLDEIDALVGRHARGWTVDRMPAVDRSVLRLATYELWHEPTKAAVVINEALELAKMLSTEASGRYVNGVLEAVRRELAADRERSARPGGGATGQGGAAGQDGSTPGPDRPGA